MRNGQAPTGRYNLTLDCSVQRGKGARAEEPATARRKDYKGSRRRGPGTLGRLGYSETPYARANILGPQWPDLPHLQEPRPLIVCELGDGHLRLGMGRAFGDTIALGGLEQTGCPVKGCPKVIGLHRGAYSMQVDGGDVVGMESPVFKGILCPIILILQAQANQRQCLCGKQRRWGPHPATPVAVEPRPASHLHGGGNIPSRWSNCAREFSCPGGGSPRCLGTLVAPAEVTEKGIPAFMTGQHLELGVCSSGRGVVDQGAPSHATAAVTGGPTQGQRQLTLGSPRKSLEGRVAWVPMWGRPPCCLPALAEERRQLLGYGGRDGGVDGVSPQEESTLALRKEGFERDVAVVTGGVGNAHVLWIKATSCRRYQASLPQSRPPHCQSWRSSAG